MSVYLRAAKRAEASNQDDYSIGCCDFLGDESGENEGLIDNFSVMFSPDEFNGEWRYWGRNWGERFSDQRRCRVLALLLAHAMHEAGDL